MSKNLMRAVSYFVILALNTASNASYDAMHSITGVEKYPANQKAVIHVSSQGGNCCSEDITCEYSAVFDRKVPIETTSRSVPECITGWKYESYKIPSSPGGSSQIKVRSDVIIPKPFLEERCTRDAVLRFLKNCPRTCSLSPLARKAPALEISRNSSSLVPDNVSLRMVLDAYSASRPCVGIDDSVLVLCKILREISPAERNAYNGQCGAYSRFKINGHRLGIFEVSRNHYQNLRAPVVIFNQKGTSFEIVDESALRHVTKNTYRY